MSIKTSVEAVSCPICGFSSCVPVKNIIPKFKHNDSYYCPRCHAVFSISQSKSVDKALAQLTLSRSDMITNKIIRIVEEYY
ncbi:MAG: hypothetical protein ACP5GU_01265 [Thermoprotei archaeon]|jgi:transposase-like protein